MELIEIVGPGHIQQFSSLLDRSFSLHKGMHYLDDFPIWSFTHPSVVRFGALSEKKELIASAGVRLVSLRLRRGDTSDAGPQSVLAALIGAVATDENYRGQGLASRLVSRVLEWSRAKGAAVAILWGAEHSLYAKLGFSLCGTQALVALESLNLPATPGVLKKGWNPQIFDLLLDRKDGAILTVQDRHWFESHRHVDWYWIGKNEKESLPLAYAAVGRGIDLGGLIHEWGGETRALLALLGRLKSEHPSLTLLGSPGGLEERGLSLKEARQEYLFLANVLQPELLGLDAADLQRTRPEGLGELCFGAPDKPAKNELWIWGLDAV
jgi:GNAT superfamily N-acetyltransferase